MNWLFERKLKKLGDKANPSPLFTRSLELRLRDELGHPVWWVQGWKWAMSAVMVVSVAGSATGVYAYTSDNVLPNHPLYGVRRGIEQVEEAIAVTPEKKVEVEVKHLKRRVHENELMASREQAVPEDRLNAVDDEVEKTIDETADLPDDARQKINDTIDHIEEHHQKVVKKVEDQEIQKEKKDAEKEAEKELKDAERESGDSQQGSGD